MRTRPSSSTSMRTRSLEALRPCTRTGWSTSPPPAPRAAAAVPCARPATSTRHEGGITVSTRQGRSSCAAARRRSSSAVNSSRSKSPPPWRATSKTSSAGAGKDQPRMRPPNSSWPWIRRRIRRTFPAGTVSSPMTVGSSSMSWTPSGSAPGAPSSTVSPWTRRAHPDWLKATSSPRRPAPARAGRATSTAPAAVWEAMCRRVSTCSAVASAPQPVTESCAEDSTTSRQPRSSSAVREGPPTAASRRSAVVRARSARAMAALRLVLTDRTPGRMLPSAWERISPTTRGRSSRSRGSWVREATTRPRVATVMVVSGRRALWARTASSRSGRGSMWSVPYMPAGGRPSKRSALSRR